MENKKLYFSWKGKNKDLKFLLNLKTSYAVGKKRSLPMKTA